MAVVLSGRAVLGPWSDLVDVLVVEQDVEHGPLPAAVEVAASRIVSEAVTNVARHAGTRYVWLGLRQVGATLVVTVSAEGRGPGPAAGRGLGSATCASAPKSWEAR